MWCKSKKEADEFRPFEANGKEKNSSDDETKSDAEKKKKEGAGRKYIVDRVSV